MQLGMKVDPRSLPTFSARSEAAQYLYPKLSYTTTDSKWSAGYVGRHWASGCVVSADTNLVILPTSFEGILYLAFTPNPCAVWVWCFGQCRFMLPLHL